MAAVTDQTPPPRCCARYSWCDASQSLKSPTTCTFRAVGATSTNCTERRGPGLVPPLRSVATSTRPVERFARNTPMKWPAESATATSSAAAMPVIIGLTVTVRVRSIRVHGRWRCRGMARTASITPRSNSSSSCTGRRSSDATRWIQRSVMFRIIHLRTPPLHTHLAIVADVTQQLTQPIAGTHDAHLERRHAGARQSRHLVVAQLLHVLEQKCFALLGAQPAQRPVDLFAPRVPLCRMLFGGIVQRQIVADERARAATAARSDGPTAIYENTKQPRAESLRILTPGERSIRARERVLQGFLRVLAIAQHVERVPRVPIAISLHQLGVQLGITPEHACDDLRVRTTIHKGETLAWSGGSPTTTTQPAGLRLGRTFCPIAPSPREAPPPQSEAGDVCSAPGA